MFKLEINNQRVEATPPDKVDLWMPNSALVREDGVRLERIGSGSEGQDFFKYRDSDISLDLMASCFDANLDPTDTWEVYLSLALKKYSSSQGVEISAAKSRMVEANICEALLTAPRYPGQPAIKQVKFL